MHMCLRSVLKEWSRSDEKGKILKNVFFKDSLKDQRIGFILIFRVQKKFHFQITLVLLEAVSTQHIRSTWKKYPTFPVPIGNLKEAGEIEYHHIYPPFEYHYNASNIFCFNSVAQALTMLRVKNPARAIAMQMEEYLCCQYKGYKDRTKFSNDIMKYHVCNLGDQRLHYSINKRIKRAVLTFFMTSVKVFP